MSYKFIRSGIESLVFGENTSTRIEAEEIGEFTNAESANLLAVAFAKRAVGEVLLALLESEDAVFDCSKVSQDVN